MSADVLVPTLRGRALPVNVQYYGDLGRVLFFFFVSKLHLSLSARFQQRIKFILHDEHSVQARPNAHKIKLESAVIMSSRACIKMLAVVA
uniref:Uncharacterized protein n=1 Tax=Anguilla anguilla TaxID=7936 RepID=A0A0E9QDS7_ANGAN